MDNAAKAEMYSKIAKKVSEAISMAAEIGDFNTDHMLRCLYHSIIQKQTKLLTL